MFSKKILFLVLMAALFLLGVGAAASAAAAKTPATAAGDIGVIDMEEVMNKHPDAEKIRQQRAELARQKESEARAAANKESDNAKKAQVVQAKRMELAQAEQKLIQPLINDCQQAVREVATKKKLSLVLANYVVLVGGNDITQDVIQQLVKKKK